MSWNWHKLPYSTWKHEICDHTLHFIWIYELQGEIKNVFLFASGDVQKNPGGALETKLFFWLIVILFYSFTFTYGFASVSYLQKTCHNLHLFLNIFVRTYSPAHCLPLLWKFSRRFKICAPWNLNIFGCINFRAPEPFLFFILLFSRNSF